MCCGHATEESRPLVICQADGFLCVMPSYFGAFFSFLAAFCRFPAQESQAYRAAIVDGAGVSSLAICGLSLTMRTTVPFEKKVAKARSESGRRRRVRPCLLKKLAKGTVRNGAQTACATVPFDKISQRHGQKGGANGVCDRAFWKKVAKARSKPEQIGHVRPCLLQRIIKGTVKIVARGSSPTGPFEKNRQRHGQKI